MGAGFWRSFHGGVEKTFDPLIALGRHGFASHSIFSTKPALMQDLDEE